MSCHHPRSIECYHCSKRCKPPYSFWYFLLDLIMTGLTGGLWLLWVILREAKGWR